MPAWMPVEISTMIFTVNSTVNSTASFMAIFTATSAAIASLIEWPAAVQLLVFLGLWGLVWLPLALVLARKLQWRPLTPLTPSQKIVLVLSLYLLAPLLLWGAATVQGVPLDTYGVVFGARALVLSVLGLGLGAVGIALLVGIQVQLGWMQWGLSPNAPSNASPDALPDVPNEISALVAVAPPILGLAAVISAVEEPIFRGLALYSLQQTWGLGLGAIAASGLFALLHLVWDWRGTWPQLPGLVVMGLVLTLARWAGDGALALAWGLHAGWVWALASLDTAQVTRPTASSPPWLTGWGGQPLAGALSWLLLVGTALLLYFGKVSGVL
jgi:uncharacterized protein